MELKLLLITVIFASANCNQFKPPSHHDHLLEYYHSVGLYDNDQLEASMGNFVVPTSAYRLNSTLKPIHYSLYMRPVLDEVKEFELFTMPSWVTILVESISHLSSNTIVMHQRNLTIDQGNVTVTNLRTGQIMQIESQHFEVDRDLYTIMLEEPYHFGDRLEIYIAYNVTMSRTENVGVYVGHYVDPKTGETRYLSTTKLEPYHARKVFPCFDEPALKATFDIHVARYAKNKEYHSLSNTNIRVTEQDYKHPEWIWDRYEKTVLMSTYLMCVIVSDFTNETVITTWRNRTVSTWAPKHDIDQDGGVLGATTGAEILNYFESRFKIDYVFNKLDAVALPQFASGAMENWGLVTYRYAYLVWIPHINTEAERRKITQVLAHEIAHQWFGNLVTCAWWSDIWLNEGFARYLQFWGMDNSLREFNITESFVHDVPQLAMVFDQGPSTHPVKNFAQSPNESAAVFDRISYEKGASLLKMMEGFMSPAIFENAIVDIYLPRMQWKSVFQDDLFDALQAAIVMYDVRQYLPPQVIMRDIMETWTLQSGYPIVRVEIVDQHSIVVSQEKFVTNSKRGNGSTVTDQSWWIPVKIVSSIYDSYDKRATFWIPNNVSSMVYNNNNMDTSKLLMLNPDCSGYYRVLYDPPMMARIRQQLLDNLELISSSSRSQFLDDCFHFAMESYMPYEPALELTRYLDKEYSSNVWVTVANHMKLICNRFTQDLPALEAYANYFLPKVDAALEIIGYRQSPGEKGITVTMRANLLELSCQLNSEKCVAYANELMAIWRANQQTNPFPVDIQSHLYCAAVASTNNTEVWNFVLDKFREAKTEGLKTGLMNALACTSDPTVLSNLLDLALSLPELKTFLSQILTRVAMNRKGRELVLVFVKQNLNSGRISSTEFASTISALSTYFNNQRQADDLEAYFGSNEEILKDVLPSLKTSLKNIQHCIKWWTMFGNRIKAWMLLQ